MRKRFVQVLSRVVGPATAARGEERVEKTLPRLLREREARVPAAWGVCRPRGAAVRGWAPKASGAGPQLRLRLRSVEEQQPSEGAAEGQGRGRGGRGIGASPGPWPVFL